MRVLLDMNLPPRFGDVLKDAAIEAEHWSEVGAPAAPDREIMAWARQRDAVVVTRDLDFGILLALTRGSGPSVVQLRAADVAPAAIGALLVATQSRFESELNDGAIVTVQRERQRVRVLPLR